MEKTIFEKIVEGEIPCDKLYEDNETFAFMDINPNTKGHSLVISKKPYKDIHEIPDEIAGAIFKTIKKLAGAIKRAVGADGINIVMNNNESAGQVVMHSHIHIIPRFKNDSGYHGKRYTYKEGEREEIKNKIIKELE